MVKRDQWLTWAEYESQLKAEGRWEEYRLKRELSEQERKRKEEKSLDSQYRLILELRDAGADVVSVWDYVNKSGRVDERIISILLDHLQRPYPPGIKEGIARAVGDPRARFAWPLLVKLYLEEMAPGTRQGLAVALANTADESVMEELIALAADPSNGESRVLLLDGLRRIGNPRAKEVLMEFGADPQLRREARRILQIIARRRKGVD